MFTTKNKASLLCALIPLSLLSTNAFSEELCDDSCKESIAFTEEMDDKKRQISKLQTDLQIARLEEEIKTLREEGQESKFSDPTIEAKMNEKLNKLEAQLMARIGSLSATLAEVDSRASMYSNSQGSLAVGGIENIFVTATTSVDSTWEATVYYNNTVENLPVGAEVYPGAKITSINRRGIVITVDGENYPKRITSSSMAYAKTFSNIKDERSSSTANARNGNTHSAYTPFYEGR